MIKSIFIFLIILSIANSQASEISISDSLQAKRNGVFGLPALFYAPETKWAGGAVLGYFYREGASSDSSRPSTFLATVVYTQRKQISSLLSNDLYLFDEQYRIRTEFTYSKFPDFFYGIGENTLKENEEDYTPRTGSAALVGQKRIAGNVYLGPWLEYRNFKLVETESDGQLSDGSIYGSDGGRIIGAGVMANFDTRSNVFYPQTGTLVEFSFIQFGAIFGGDYDFARIGFDFRKYYSPKYRHVLALETLYNISTGKPPFNYLSLLGGSDMMRGYYEGRYRDKHLLAFQAEYRIVPVIGRFGIVGFLAAGDVAPSFSDYWKNAIKLSGGIGFRFQFNRKEDLNIRFDLGVGKKSSGFYIAGSEAF